MVENEDSIFIISIFRVRQREYKESIKDSERQLKYLFPFLFWRHPRPIIKEIIKEVDKTNLIKTNHYWGLSDKTIKDFLISKNRKDVWEDGNLWSDNVTGKHPNKIGYELIANMLYDYISEKDILYYNTNEIQNRIIWNIQ